MNKKLAFTVLAILFLSGQIFAQVGITAYNQSAISIISPKSNLLQLELKTFLNVNARNTRFEALVLYPFVERPTHRFLFGGGLQTGFGNSDLPNPFFCVPVQAEITPFEQVKQLALALEVAPLIIENNVIIRYMFGLRYYFGKKKETSE